MTVDFAAKPCRPEACAETVRVELCARAYDIVVGESLLDRAGALIKPVLRQPRIAVITDDTVAPLYLPRLRAACAAEAIHVDGVVLPAGEQTKDFGHLQTLCERLLAARIERGATLVALGGGVIGDLAGFAAGILLRGLDFVQVPTTLLAQVDSSVGGKTGINTSQGKNLVGLFHQPRLVLADVATLDTLDPRQVRAGYAEVAKYGLIGDAGFFAWLEANGPALVGGDRALRRRAVLVSCAAKAGIVAADEREAGERALLNLGHTFGHALEAETGFSDALLHGEAVAIGMVLAFDLSVRLGLCAAADRDRIRRHLEAVGLPVGMTRGSDRRWSVDALIGHMRHDKKVRDGRMTFVLAHGIGRAFLSRDVPIEAVADVLRAAAGE
jgi:3-dehydroquinate synthase